MNLLKKIQTRRNEVAHQGYLLNRDDLTQSSLVETKINQVKQDLEQAKECLSMLHDEAFRLENIVNALFYPERK